MRTPIRSSRVCTFGVTVGRSPRRPKQKSTFSAAATIARIYGVANGVETFQDCLPSPSKSTSRKPPCLTRHSLYNLLIISVRQRCCSVLSIIPDSESLFSYYRRRRRKTSLCNWSASYGEQPDEGRLHGRTGYHDYRVWVACHFTLLL